MKRVHALLMAMSKETGEVFESERFIEVEADADIYDAVSRAMEDWWPCMDFIWATFVIDRSFSVDMAYANFAKYISAWFEKRNSEVCYV